jgi:hypothetical protein
MGISTQSDWVRGDDYYITNGTHTICKVKYPDGWAYEAWRLALKNQRGTFSHKIGHWIYGDDKAKKAKMDAYSLALACVDADKTSLSESP